MSAVRQIGIRMTVDAQSVTTELPKAAREFENLGASADRAGTKSTRSLAQVSMSVRDIVSGAAGLHIVGSALQSITDALTALPRNAFDYSKNLEVSQVGMAGILGSMTSINGKQLQYNQALQISSEYIRKLNDDALRTAATSQELTQVFQALLAPGLSANMTLEQIRQLTVVGTNAVKSMGLDAGQVIQELRDLVAGGITPASSTLASALGLKDADIAKAKASSEGLFQFLMDRLKGFQASSEAFGDTLKGKLDQLKEGATIAVAKGIDPLYEASKNAAGELAKLFITIDESNNVQPNPSLVAGIDKYAEYAANAISTTRDLSRTIYENRDAIEVLAIGYGALKIGQVISGTVAAAAAKAEAAQASRLLTMQQAAESASNVEVATTSRQKIAAYLAELEAKAANAQATVAAQAAELARLATTQEAIVVARAQTVAQLEATRTTIAQAEAQLVAARAAGAQSFALAAVREATTTLTVAQARHAALVSELALLGKQQASVQAGITAATAAQTAATTAATTATASLTAAQGAASLASRTFGAVMGALGGSVGIAITAVSALAYWLYKLKSAADDAAGARMKYGRAMMAVQNGTVAEDRDIIAMRAEKARLEAEMDELQTKGSKGERKKTEFNGTPLNLDVDGYRNQINAVQVDIDRVLAHNQRLATAGGQASQNLALTVSGAEQAWRKANDGIKTSSAIQDEYNSKLSASQNAWKTYQASLMKSGADQSVIDKAQREQAQAEKALADDRDKKIKELGAGAASARSRAIDGEIAATKQGYKLLQAQTESSLAEIEAQRKQGLLSDSDALEKRTALQLADNDAQRAALEQQLSLMRGKNDADQARATVLGELQVLEQQRRNIEAAAAREQVAIDAEVAQALERRITASMTAANQAQESVRLARLESEEIGKTGAALGTLRQARVEEVAAQLEAEAVTQEGIDLSGRASAALRAQAAAVRDLAKVSGYNESAKMVDEYTRSIKEANDATRYEASLAIMSQRDREIALEQYRIAIDLKKRLEEIDAKNPADAAAAEKLKSDATAAAAQAMVGASARVYARELTQSVEQMDDIFRKGFADMLNDGEDKWKAFNKSLTTSFKTSVADQLYKAFAQPFIVPVIASIQGMVGGITGSNSSSSGASGGAANPLGLLQSGQNLWSAFSGGLSGTLATGVTQLGSLMGSSFLGELGAGIAAGGQLGIGGTASLIGSAGGTTGVGMTIGAAAPWIAGAAALYSIIKSFDNSGTPHMGAGAIYSGGQVSDGRDIYNRATFGMGAAGEWSSSNQAAISGIAGTLGASLDGFAKAFGKEAGYTVATAFADDSSGDGAWGSLRIEDALGNVLTDWEQSRSSKWAPKTFADGEEGYKQYLAAAAVDVKSAMLAMDLPGWADQLLNAATDLDTLNAALGQIAANKAGFDALGQSMSMFKGISEELQTQLLTASGGMDVLASSAAGYYSAFYSEAERMESLSVQVQTALAGLDISLDPRMGEAAKQQFAATVEAAMAAGQGELAVKLMAMSQSFATAADYAAKAASDAAKAAADARQGAWDSAMASLEAAVDREKSYWQGIQSAAQTAISTLSSTLNLLTSNARELYGTVDGTAQMLAAQGMVYVENALAAVRGGAAVTDFGQLQDAISAARGGINNGAYVSLLDRERDTLLLANQLSELGGLTDSQLTVQDRQLRAAESQIKRLDETLSYWQQALSYDQLQIDATMSVGQAVAALGPLLAALQSANASTYASAITGVTSRTPEEKAALYQQMLAAGLSDTQIRDQVNKTTGQQTDADWDYLRKLAGVPGFATGGDHLGGLRIVGERGWELEATGPSRIWNQQQLAQALGGGSRDSSRTDALLAEITSSNRRLADKLGAVEDENRRMRTVLEAIARGEVVVMTKPERTT
jgi:hypothetical protein